MGMCMENIYNNKLLRGKIMIDIKLNDGQSGYGVVGEYIRRYWEHNIYDTVVVSIGTSYNGNTYNLRNEIASPYNFDDIEYFIS